MTNDEKFTVEDVTDSTIKRFGSHVVIYVPEHFFKDAKSIKVVSKKDGKGHRPVKFANESFITFNKGAKKSMVEKYEEKGNKLREKYDNTFNELKEVINDRDDGSYNYLDVSSLLIDELSRLHVALIDTEYKRRKKEEKASKAFKLAPSTLERIKKNIEKLGIARSNAISASKYEFESLREKIGEYGKGADNNIDEFLNKFDNPNNIPRKVGEASEETISMPEYTPYERPIEPQNIPEMNSQPREPAVEENLMNQPSSPDRNSEEFVPPMFDYQKYKIKPEESVGEDRPQVDKTPSIFNEFAEDNRVYNHVRDENEKNADAFLDSIFSKRVATEESKPVVEDQPTVAIADEDIPQPIIQEKSRADAFARSFDKSIFSQGAPAEEPKPVVEDQSVVAPTSDNASQSIIEENDNGNALADAFLNSVFGKKTEIEEPKPVVEDQSVIAPTNDNVSQTTVEPTIGTVPDDILSPVPERAPSVVESAAEYADMAEERNSSSNLEPKKIGSGVIDAMQYVREQEEKRKSDMILQEKLAEARKMLEDYKKFLAQNGISEDALTDESTKKI